MTDRATHISSNLPGHWLLHLRDQYGFDRFVETGTCCADTTVLAALVFREVWTVEISDEHTERARERLKGYPHVHAVQGDSVAFLQSFWPLRFTIGHRTIFWLDAHYCGGTFRPQHECALLDELRTFGKLPNEELVLIDDAHLFVDGPPEPHDRSQWPTYTDIQHCVAGWNAHINIRQNIIIIGPDRLKDFIYGP